MYYWSWRSMNRLIVLKIIARLPASAHTRHLHRPRQPRGQRFGEKNSGKHFLGADLAHGGTNSGPLDDRFCRYSHPKVPVKSWVDIILHIVLVLLAHAWKSLLDVEHLSAPSSELARAMVTRSRENYFDNCTPRVDSDFHGGWESKFELWPISKQHSCIYTLYSNSDSVPVLRSHAIRPRVPALTTSWKFTAAPKFGLENGMINSNITIE